MIVDKNDSAALAEKIVALKKERRAVILAHYYTLPKCSGSPISPATVWRCRSGRPRRIPGSFSSPASISWPKRPRSSRRTRRCSCPNPGLRCSLADSCSEKDFARFLENYPDHTVVSYVNTSVGVKALTDICCTSGNAVEVIESIPRERKIVFAPDRNLGNYIKSLTGRQDMVVWDGACGVHEEFSVEKILELKKQHPDAKVLAHPECRKAVLLTADYIGSTAALLKFSSEDPAREFIVVTEAGILYRMQQENPEKTFIPAPPSDSTCGCNNCSFMKMVTLEKIYRTLRDESPEVVLDEEVRRKAEGSIRRMLAIRRG